MTKEKINKIKADRFSFLNRLYKFGGGNPYQIGSELGLGRDETDEVEEYLADEGLIAYPELGGKIEITHSGKVQVEKVISHPESPTKYFPAINFIQIGNMANSQIQQATHSSIQTSTIDTYEKTQVENLLSEIKSALKSMNINHQTQKDLFGEIATIEGQLKISNPKKSIIKESLTSVRTILEQTGAAVLATQIASMLTLFG